MWHSKNRNGLSTTVNATFAFAEQFCLTQGLHQMLARLAFAHESISQCDILLWNNLKRGKPPQNFILPSIPHWPLVTVQSMIPRGKFQIFRGDFAALQGVVEQTAVNRRDRSIVQSVGQKSRGRLRRYLLFVRKLRYPFLGRRRPKQVSLGPGMR